MPRKLVGTENQNFQGFGCSACNWVFKSSGEFVRESLNEMKQKYEAQRDQEFAAQVCVKHPRTMRPKTEWVAAVITDIVGTGSASRMRNK